ncbi:MAG TPA: lipopolysaccharide kinase InaA family protein [Planctomycetota bacterium]
MALLLDGYDSVYSGPHLVLIRPEWRPYLLEDVLSDFEKVTAEERTGFRGRVEHFAYQPKGAPGRVLVRELARGGLARFAGNIHLGMKRILRELRAVLRARTAGLNVPEIVACRATHAFGPFHRFTLVVREIAGARDLLALARETAPARHRRIIADVAGEVRRMHEAGLYHGDLNVKNILLQGTEVYFIDLDRAVLRMARDPGLDAANLSRLNRSVEKWLKDRVSRVDRLRFLFTYVQDRARIRDLARRCGAGLWFHRFWWALTGPAAK